MAIPKLRKEANKIEDKSRKELFTKYLDVLQSNKQLNPTCGFSSFYDSMMSLIEHSKNENNEDIVFSDYIQSHYKYYITSAAKSGDEQCEDDNEDMSFLLDNCCGVAPNITKKTALVWRCRSEFFISTLC